MRYLSKSAVILHDLEGLTVVVAIHLKTEADTRRQILLLGRRAAINREQRRQGENDQSQNLRNLHGTLLSAV